MIEHGGELSLARQCALLGVSRSSQYYAPSGESAENLALMRRMDELHLAHPFYGSRQMARHLRREGVVAGRHRIRRLRGLMGLEAVYCRPRTSAPNPAHRVYPYLLRDLTIDRPDQATRLQYKSTTDTGWTDGPQDEAGTSAAIGGLAEDTAYEVRLRARKVDGDGAWSQPGSGRTGEAAVVDGPALAGLFPTASDEVREGFVPVINHSAEAGEVTVAAIDGAGMRAGPVVLTLAGDATAHFNSDDLEAGNADKGLPDGVGPPGEGDWRLELASELDIEALSYIRTEDGFLTAMHDVAPMADGERRVAIFNPAVNPDQVSRLRLINPAAEDAEATVTGVDATARRRVPRS